MSTIVCTRQEFNAIYCDFQKIAGSTNSTQDEVALAFRCLVLHYLGCKFDNDDQMYFAAGALENAMHGAIRRGWHLISSDLTRD